MLKLRWLVLAPLIIAGVRKLANAGQAKRKTDHRSECLDDALQDSFPASDPPSMASSTTAGL